MEMDVLRCRETQQDALPGPDLEFQYSMSLLPYLHRVADRHNLAAQDACEAMQVILDGGASPAQIAAFLTALRMKGETAEELAGFALAMRSRAHPIPLERDGRALLDTCGTGGDGACTFNISTVAAFVAAGAGARVAKHGNRSISSQCGSADLLEAMGIQVGMEAQRVAEAIQQVGIGFLFAPALHTAMKHAQPVRVELKMRTVFNLLGPLTNPASATVQLVGAPSEHAAGLMAAALATLGVERALVVHGSDGLDEITTTGPTTVICVHGGTVVRGRVEPGDFGVPQARSGDLKGGDKDENCRIAMDVLNGARGPQRDIVLVNAAAALVTAGIASDYREGVERAAESIDSGAAHAKAGELRRFTLSAGAART
jgi:anthranilate phosphoribosyltransferase